MTEEVKKLAGLKKGGKIEGERNGSIGSLEDL